MRFRRNRAIILIVAALLAVTWGVYHTDNQPPLPSSRAARRAPSDRTVMVDQSSLLTVETLMRGPVTADERPFAEDALRIADNEMDLAFAQAVRRTTNQPPATSATALEANARLQQALRTLAADQERVRALTAVVAKANVANAQSRSRTSSSASWTGSC